MCFATKIKHDGGDMARHLSRRGSSRGEKWAKETRFGTMNVCGGMHEKLDEVCLIMEERKLDFLCVNETKRKEKEVSQLGPFTAIWSGVAESDRACQGVGLLISERMAKCMKDYACVSPRLLWIKVKVGLVRMRIICVYAPDMSRSLSEREEFWNLLDDVANGCDENEKIVMLGDFNGWVGVSRNGCERVLGKFGDKRVNENGEKVIDVCLERNLCVTNTLFEHKDIHMYTRQRGSERSMIDFVIVDERLRAKVVDTRVHRGINVGTDHFLVISRLRGLCTRWRHRAKVSTTEFARIKVEKLEEDENIRDEYMKKLDDRLSCVEMKDELEIEEVWDVLKSSMVECATEVCGLSKRTNRPPTSWWDKDVKEAVGDKKKAWLDLLAIKASKRMDARVTDDVVKNSEDEYKRVKNEVKKKIEKKKRDLIEWCERKLSDNFRNNQKLFWKYIRKEKGVSQNTRVNVVRDEQGELATDESSIRRVWKNYFEGLFEKEDTSISSPIGSNVDWNDVMGDFSDSEISMEEIMKAMKSMKLGKAAGYDRINTEMLRAGKGVVASWLYFLFQKCWSSGKVPQDWCKAVIVPLYKGKGSHQEARNYRGISLLSIVGKLYAKVLIERVMNETDDKIWDVQAGFRKGMGCMDQIFSLRSITEKFLAKNRKVYCSFIDLEKAYDRVVRKCLWEVLSKFGLGSRLIRALVSLYEDSSACVRVNGENTDWFGISRGVRQGCVASPWLFNLFMDDCLTELRESDYGLRMGGFIIKCLLYADDQVLLASSVEELQEMMNIACASFEKKGMRVNVDKTKTMVFEREVNMTECVIEINGKKVEQVKEFVYLGSLFTRDGKCDEDIERRVKKGNAVNGALDSLMSSQSVSEKARMAVHDAVLVPTLMYGSECWVWQKKHESRVNAVEMRSLRKVCNVRLCDRVRNDVIRERCGVKDDIVRKIEKGMLRWFGHIERMDDSKLVKEIYRANVEGNVSRGRPRRTHLDQIEHVLKKAGVRSMKNKRACMKRLMDVNEAREVCQDRTKWRSIVSAYPNGN